MSIEQLGFEVVVVSGRIVAAWHLLRVLRKVRQVLHIQEVDLSDFVGEHQPNDRLKTILVSGRGEFYWYDGRHLFPVFAIRSDGEYLLDVERLDAWYVFRWVRRGQYGVKAIELYKFLLVVADGDQILL